ncbi:MAG: BMP family lipoprotein [Actinomycetota bacterium]
MSKWFKVLSAVAAFSIVATACGNGGEAEPSPEAEPGADFLACQVTDVGGIDDRSFNQTAFAGLERSETELGVEIAFLESQQQTDYEPNINAFLERGCDIIITVGFLLGDATQAAAEANPDQNFAIVDFAYDPPLDNVLALTFATDQAAFLAGYLAAGVSKTGKIGTYGGIQLPTVTIFMDGLWAGVHYYNQQNKADVEVLGWDPDRETGLFTGDFEDQAKGRQTTEDLIAEGADIILPVAGPVGGGTTAAVEDSKEEDAVVWVDTDGCVSVADSCSLFVTSILKNMDVAVFESVQAVVDGTFEGGTYVGTLENDGVGLAPFHEFEAAVPDDLAQEIEKIRQGIIDGEISVSPKDYQ